MAMDQKNIGGSMQAQQTGQTEKIKGIFSTQSVVKVGTGSTVRKTIQKTYWFVAENDNNDIDIQPLNKNYIPTGPKRLVGKEDFLNRFSPEPEFYVSTVFPRMKELNKTVERGEDHRDKGEFYSAEFEFQNAVKVDEENVKANFGLGLTYLERGDRNKANDIFERLVKLDAAFQPEHKHLFNEFGINLRKNRMYDQSLDYYRRALELTQNDENLFYNIGRAHFEKGEIKQAEENLQKALSMNPQLEVARKFLEYLEKRSKSGDAAPPPPEDQDLKRASGDKRLEL